MHRLLIIADDLTGAADCGIPCLAAGLETVVVLKDDEPIPSADVVSVDAATRQLSAAQAAEQTTRLARRYSSPQTQALFKKLDSTLRGHVAEEIAAVLSVSRALHGARSLAIVAPAFPQMGRTMVGGRLWVRGVPVETTELWHREALNAFPYLPDRLSEHGLRTTHIDLHTVRSGERLSGALAGASAEHDAVVCDAETDADLRAIVRAGVALQTSIVWAGSAGLAAQLPQTLRIGREPSKSVLPPPALRPALWVGGAKPPLNGASLASNGPLLFVIGSPSQASREQIPALVANREIESVMVSLSTLRQGAHSAVWVDLTRRLERAFSTRRDIVLSLDMEGRPGADNQVSAHADVAALTSALATLVSPYAARCSGFVLTGGETARSVLDSLGVATLRLVGEVEPGIPLSLATVASGSRCVPVVTKAGAFGSRQSLLSCHDAIRALLT